MCISRGRKGIARTLLVLCTSAACAAGLATVVSLVASSSNPRGYLGENVEYVFIYSLIVLPLSAIVGALVASLGVVGGRMASGIGMGVWPRAFLVGILMGLASAGALSLLLLAFPGSISLVVFGAVSVIVISFGGIILSARVVSGPRNRDRRTS